MGFWKALFGGEELSPEEEKQQQEQKRFDLLKYDGVRAMKTGQLAIAESCLREALKMKEDLEIRDYLWQILLHTDRIDEALEELQVLSQAQPGNAEVLLQTANVAYMKEDYALMEQVLEPLTSEPFPTEKDREPMARACFLMAQARKGQQDQAGTLHWLDKAIDTDEEMASSYLLRGQTRLLSGDMEGAQADISWLMANVGPTEEVLLLMAGFETAAGRQEEAIKVLSTVLDENPFSLIALQQRAALRRQTGDEAGADEDLQAARELNPEQNTEDIERQVQDAYKNVNPLGI